jgi:hypothetical protein
MNTLTQDLQETNNESPKVGDLLMLTLIPEPLQPTIFRTHKVDNEWGVVYYYRYDGVEQSIGMAYVKKVSI